MRRDRRSGVGASQAHKVRAPKIVACIGGDVAGDEDVRPDVADFSNFDVGIVCSSAAQSTIARELKQ